MSTIDKLFTSVHFPGYLPKITYRDYITMAGSCFTEHISRKMDRYNYRILSNPFGILYNPHSLAKSFRRITAAEYYHGEELIFHDGLYHSMDHHGSFSGSDKEKVLQNINESIDRSRLHLINSKFVFVSLGTAIVYKHNSHGEIVGNNHKIPSVHFDSVALSMDECLQEMEIMYENIKSLNPDTHLLWTVSPVRHMRDGLIENQRSKSALILAIGKFIQAYADTGYFPAYEIMLDQLRDYRYYARDLVHPSDVAIDIIWELFSDTYIDPQESQYHKIMEKIRRAMEHRFLHDDRNAIKSFAEEQLRNIQRIADLFPDMDLKEERQYFFHLIEPD